MSWTTREKRYGGRAKIAELRQKQVKALTDIINARFRTHPALANLARENLEWLGGHQSRVLGPERIALLESTTT